MNAAIDSAAIVTEDYADQDVSQDTIQYHYRDYKFWSGEPLNRSVNRFKGSNAIARRYGFGIIAPHSPAEMFSEEGLNGDVVEVIDLPAVFRARTIGEKSVNTLQEWECVVTSIEQNTVQTQATSMIDRSTSQHYMDIPLTEFSIEDREILTNGTVFRIIVGYVKKANGARTRESLIYVRSRLPRQKTTIDQTLDFFSMD